MSLAIRCDASHKRPVLLGWVVFVVVLMLWFVQTKDSYEPGSWNDGSRLAAIESLVERGTWQIDDSFFLQWTGDKLFLRGHWYSSKPPLFQALGAVIYSVLRLAFDVSLAPVAGGGTAITGYKALTFLTVGLASAAMLALFYLFLIRLNFSARVALLTTVLLAFGTMVWPYSLVLNNHVPAAACLFAGFYLLSGSGVAPTKCSRRLFWAGLLAALAASFDLEASLIALALLAIAILRYRNGAWYFALGAALPIIATMALDYHITGSILPPYFAVGGYDYAGSNWSTTVAALKSAQNVTLYAFRATFGDRGVVSHSPVLLWAIAGLLAVVRAPRHFFRLESCFIFLVILGQVAYILLSTDNFGGRAYSIRWFIIWLPLVFCYLPHALPRSGSPASALNASLFTVAALLSVASAYQGVQSTWTESRPLFYVCPRSEPPYFGLYDQLGIGRGEKPVQVLKQLNCPRWELEGATTYAEVPAMQHKVMANFDDKIMLIGYDLPARRARAGESFPITVYWQKLSDTKENYFQSNQLLDVQLRRMGGVDRRPMRSHTACWDMDEVLADHYSVPVYAEATDGVYYLMIGVYQGLSEQATYLPLVHEGRRQEVANVTIGPIKVGGPPPGTVVNSCSPKHRVNISLGDVIQLVGYDLTQREQSLQLRVCWQSIAQTENNYTVFVHLLNQSGEMVAQMDQPPLQGAYPTAVWDPGEIVPDDIAVPLPQALSGGEYILEVGLYDPISGERLCVSDCSTDAIRLPTTVIDNR